MRSRIAQEELRRKSQRMDDRHGGAPPSKGLRMSAHRTADAQVLHIGRLPCLLNGIQVQTSTGAMVNLPGYSKAGGPDIGS